MVWLQHCCQNRWPQKRLSKYANGLVLDKNLGRLKNGYIVSRIDIETGNNYLTQNTHHYNVSTSRRTCASCKCTDIYYGILSGICLGIISSIHSGTLSGIYSGIRLSGINADILSDIFWRSILYIFYLGYFLAFYIFWRSLW